MNNTSVEMYKLFGHTTLGGNDLIGFTLPLFHKYGDNTKFYIQVQDEYKLTIQEMRRIDWPDIPVTELTSEISVSIGDHQIFTFKYEEEIILGNIKDIEIYLKAIAENKVVEPGLKMQIFHLVGDDDQKKGARAEVYKYIESQSGPETARLFRDYSIVPCIFWDKIKQISKSESSARRIISGRNKIRFTSDKDGNLDIDMSAANLEDFKLDEVSEVMKEIQDEIHQIQNNKSNNESSKKIEEFRQEIIDYLVKISKSGRQEERIAILLESFVKNKPIGEGVLQSYSSDRSRFADNAISLIKKQLINNGNDKFTEIIAAKIIIDLFNKAFPYNRGFLLYYASKHLSGNKIISETIKSILNKTKSAHVLRFDEAIREELRQS